MTDEISATNKTNLNSPAPYHHDNAPDSQQTNHRAKMPLPEVEQILQKYKQEEEKVDILFKQIEKKDESRSVDEEDKHRQFVSFEEAKERNKNLLKDLETVKGNLRSKAIFSPTEMQWETICKHYQDEPSLPVTTWKCNVPIFV
ncbi:hypothetical protein Zmor_023042 [Zophobas morio]|uniref:Uncharacterized protein n=1 Tax=Zophobas morio TaxID=2755281 RepID=A0AA38HXE9_9CUCU|nr:hypothetical protein Zmor_023042 [Zophobas morio]